MMEASDGSVPLDGELRSALATLDAADLVARAEGTDRELDWERLLSLRDQQALGARAHAHRAARALRSSTTSADRRRRAARAVFAAFAERGITCVAFGGDDEPRDAYDMVLVLAPDGTWSVES